MKVEFAGVALKNPIVIASGPLTCSLDLLKRAEDSGAAGASLKLTFDHVPFPGKLRSHSLPGKGLLFGIDRRLNRDEGLNLMRKAKEQTSLVLMANLTSPSSDLEKWVSLARDFEQAGADMIEANLTCPHIGLPADTLGEKVREELRSGGMIGQIPELCLLITRALKGALADPRCPQALFESPPFPGDRQGRRAGRGRRHQHQQHDGELPALSRCLRTGSSPNPSPGWGQHRHCFREPFVEACGVRQDRDDQQKYQAPDYFLGWNFELGRYRSNNHVGGLGRRRLYPPHVVRVRRDPQDAGWPAALPGRAAHRIPCRSPGALPPVPDHAGCHSDPQRLGRCRRDKMQRLQAMPETRPLHCRVHAGKKGAR